MVFHLGNVISLTNMQTSMNIMNEVQNFLSVYLSSGNVNFSEKKELPSLGSARNGAHCLSVILDQTLTWI